VSLELERVVDGLVVFGDELDMELLDHAVELVDLAGVQLKLVESQRHLCGVQLAGLTAALQELPRLH
jgi:hypothetical protein